MENKELYLAEALEHLLRHYVWEYKPYSKKDNPLETEVVKQALEALATCGVTDPLHDEFGSLPGTGKR